MHQSTSLTGGNVNTKQSTWRTYLSVSYHVFFSNEIVLSYGYLKMQIEFILMMSEGLVCGLRGLIEVQRGKYKAYRQGIKMIRPNLSPKENARYRR